MCSTNSPQNKHKLIEDYPEDHPMRKYSPKKTSYHFCCAACNARLTQFRKSKLLPNGEEEYLCMNCRYAARAAENIRYHDYVWEKIDDIPKTEDHEFEYNPFL